MPPAPETYEHRVVVGNPAEEAENRIHSDEVARRHGFSGGLVPGVTVYAHLCSPVRAALGERWLAEGRAEVRFVAPCYQGEELVTTVTRTREGTLEVVAAVGERRCAVGSAGLGGGPPPTEIPRRPLPDVRPAASAAVLAPGAVLGAVRLNTDDATVAAYLDEISEAPAARPEVVHPGLLLQGANQVLVANTVLPAWLHVGSEVRHFRTVRVGEDVSVRARVADAFERRGHRFVALDVVWMAGAAPVAAARHTAIWQLAR